MLTIVVQSNLKSYCESGKPLVTFSFGHAVVLKFEVARPLLSSSKAHRGPRRKYRDDVYPKVKVRQDQYKEDHRVIQDNNLKALQSLSLRVSPHPGVRNQKGVSHPSSAEVPKCYVPQAPNPRVPVSEDLEACNLASDSSGLTGPEKDDNLDDDRVKIRASPIPPPRAVVSSPINDAMFGNKNRIKGRERLAGSMNNCVLQNRHALCKVKSSNVNENSPNISKPKEGADKSSKPKQAAADKSSKTKEAADKSCKPKEAADKSCKPKEATDKSSNVTVSVQKRGSTKSASKPKTHPKEWEF